MTRNQIEYANQQESLRHNTAVEAETQRYNTNYIAELNRHNKKMEKLTKQQIEASIINAAAAAEASRYSADQHRYATDVGALNQQLQAEVARYTANLNAGVQREHFIAMDTENARHNLALESINQQNASIGQQNANTNRMSTINQNNQWLRDFNAFERARLRNIQSQTFSNYSQGFRNIADPVLKIFQFIPVKGYH